MSEIVLGKRIPIGATVGGLSTFGFSIWNMLNPDFQFSVGEVGGFSIALTAAAQTIVVNTLGITKPSKD